VNDVFGRLSSRKAYAVLVILILLTASTFAVAKKIRSKKAIPKAKVMWREPNDAASRDLYLGPGGESMKPDLRRLTLIKVEPGGYSKKYRVRDASGREWIAKVGKEAQSETAATRLLWGTGYYTDVDYLVPSVHVEGLNKTLKNVRFGARPKNEERLDDPWKWKKNPFVGKREFQGLKVMMALLNNWDTKDSNNRVIVTSDEKGDDEARYVVHDLGGTFGKKMNWFERNLLFKRDRNSPNGYAKARLVKKVENGRVHFNYWSKNGGVFKDVSVADAEWAAAQLSRLSPAQIADAFRAANYSPQQVRILTAAVQRRIAELNNLPRSERVARR